MEHDVASLRLTLVHLACFCTAVLAVPALAVDGAKAAMSMAKQAAAAYESGDHARAAQLYLEAWRTDPQPAYLFAAARAQHVGGQADKALERYQEFLTKPGASPELVAKATRYRDELLAQRADAVALDADRARRTGDHALAARLFAEAFKLAPARLALLLQAGVAAHAAGDLAAAETHLSAWLAQAPADAAERAEASVRLHSTQQRAQPVLLAAAPTPVTVSTAPSRSMPAIATVTAPRAQGPAWLLVGGGTALLAGGALWYHAQGAERDQLEHWRTTTVGGKIAGTDAQTYESLRAKVQQAHTVAALAGGVGIAAVGLGVWWLLDAPVAVGPGPVPAGAALAWRF